MVEPLRETVDCVVIGKKSMRRMAARLAAVGTALLTEAVGVEVLAVELAHVASAPPQKRLKMSNTIMLAKMRVNQN